MDVLSVTDGGIIHEGVLRLLAGIEADLQVTAYTNFWALPEQARAGYDPDLILLEDRPEICDVFKCLAALLSQLPGVPLVVLLRNDRLERQRRAVREGARGVASIGVSRQMFGAIVKTVLAGGVYVPESLLRSLLDRETATARPLLAERDASSALAQRQNEVLDLLSTGKLNKNIAAALDIEASTVKQHLHAFFSRARCR